MIKQMRQALYGFIKRRGEPLQVSGLSDELLDGVRLMQQVGFSSDLPVDSQVVMVPIGGRATNMVIIASSDAPIVVKAGEGETVIYDQFGHSVWLKEDGTHIKGDLFVDGNIESTQDIKADGQVQDHKGTMQQIRDTYNGHVHGSSSGPNKGM